MADSTMPILATGAISWTNKVILNGEGLDVRIPVATGFAAMAFALLERANRRLSVSVAWIALLTVLFARLRPGQPAPIENLLKYWNQGRE